MSLLNQLQQQFPRLPWRSHEMLAKHNPLGIGGPAEVFVEIKQEADLLQVVDFAYHQKIAFTILGWGANTLIADRGLTGLVIKNSVNQINVNPSSDREWPESPFIVPARYQNTAQVFDQLDYSEADKTDVRVDISAGTPLSYAINALINQSITGLQWFAKIPATIGGAIFNNIHGGNHFICEFLVGVSAIQYNGQRVTYLPSELEFDYDSSRFHHHQDIILTGHFLLKRGDGDRARKTAMTWAELKAHQPARSLGCIFQNLTNQQQHDLDLPTPSVAYLIEHKLNLKGHRIGDCQISLAHAAFIENIGQGTASDYLALIQLIIKRAKSELGVLLKPEIFFKGFTRSELSGII